MISKKINTLLNELLIPVLIALGVIAILAALLPGIRSNDDMGRNMLFNLVTEIFIFGSTYCLVTRYQEKQKDSARQLLYGKLLRWSNRFLITICRQLQNNHDDTCSEIEMMSYIKDLQSKNFDGLPNLIEECLTKQPDSYATCVHAVKNEFDTILSLAITFLELGPANLLLRLDNRLSAIPADAKLSEPGARKEFAVKLANAVSATYEVKRWLQKRLED